MLGIWTQVKVINPDHPRFGTAGSVQANDADKPDQAGVKFDTDNVIEFVPIKDLQVLI